MTDLPPLMRDQRKTDADHLRLLAIFHYVFAGLSVLGLAFLALHYAFMHAMFSHPEMWKNSNGAAPPPREFLEMFVWFYIFFAVVFVAVGIGNLLSARFLQKRRNRVFSLVIAGLDVLQFPFGTVLGVFTFIVLMRDSVHELYGA
jgi:cytochrome c biogenesis protein CcdA